jgi:hypothetical protein
MDAWPRQTLAHLASHPWPDVSVRNQHSIRDSIRPHDPRTTAQTYRKGGRFSVRYSEAHSNGKLDSIDIIPIGGSDPCSATGYRIAANCCHCISLAPVMAADMPQRSPLRWSGRAPPRRRKPTQAAHRWSDAVGDPVAKARAIAFAQGPVPACDSASFPISP